MLNKETQDALSKLGFDVSKLVDAVKAENEVSLDVPKLLTEEETKGLLTEDQKVTFGQNRFNEGKNAMSEIMAKQYKEKFGLDLEGKELDKVVQAIHDKGLESGNDKELSGRFKNLQTKHQSSLEQIEQMKKVHATEIMQRDQRFNLLTSLDAGTKTKLPLNDLVDLYMMRHQIDSEEGRAVVKINNEIVKDNLESPLMPKEHFKTWVDQNYIDRSGMGGGDESGGAGGSATFQNREEAMEYMTNNGIEPMSTEGLKIMSDLKV